MRSLGEFRTFYEQELRAILAPLERRRARWLGIRRLGPLLGVSAGLAICSWGLFERGSAEIALGGLAAGLAVALGPRSMAPRSWSRDFKRQVLQRIVAFFDPSFRYDQRVALELSSLLASQLFARPDSWAAEDQVRGRIGRTDFELCEIWLRQRVMEEGSSHHETYFHGLYFAADFHKDFRSATLLLPDGAESLWGELGRFLQRIDPGREQPLVEFEDPDFERLFEVRAEDPIEARYLLSPAMMKRLVDYHRRSRSLLRVSFVGSRIHVGIERERGFFDPSASERLDSFENLSRCYEDLALVFGLVEDLKLNTRIWSKP